MAIGDGNYNNGGQQGGSNSRVFEPTYYSRLRFRSADDKSLTINYRSGLMMIEISSVDKTTFKATPLGNIFLSPIKASMLNAEIKSFKEYLQKDKVQENVAFGVNGGMGEKVSYIGFHTNKNKDVIITIGKFDDKGQIIESNTFTFQKDYNYSLEWKDISKMDIEKVFHSMVELDMLHNAIADFARFMTGAAGYASSDLNRYDNARISNKLDPIYDKLGIERRVFNSGSNYNSNNNFLNNASSSVSSKSTSIEEMGSLLD